MYIQYKDDTGKRSRNSHWGYLAFALVALAVPNGLYVYYAITQPELNAQAIRNPIALAFMLEAMMLLGLFLVHVYRSSRSWTKVLVYLMLSFVGSLAFSYPLYKYMSRRNG